MCSSRHTRHKIGKSKHERFDYACEEKSSAKVCEKIWTAQKSRWGFRRCCFNVNKSGVPIEQKAIIRQRQYPPPPYVTLALSHPPALCYKQELVGPGSYANRQAFACPAGRYGASHGLSSSRCSGTCSPGFYCPSASVSPRERACGGASLICPAGSGRPIRIEDG